MTAVVLRGDARQLPLPDASVDLIVTSPPFYALRSYTDGGQHYAGQIGSEATPQAYIAALLDCTREWVRVLKPSGSLFVDLGDKYATSLHSYNYRDPGTYTRKTPQPDGEWSKTGWHGKPNTQPARQEPNAPPKSLMLLPERYRIAAVDELGLIARAVVIWSKPNGLPESVQDRVRRSHEDWVCIRKTWPDEPCPPDVVEAVLRAVAGHEISVEDAAAILSGELIPAEGFVHLVKQPRYFAAVDNIREAHAEPNGRPAYGRERPPAPGGNRGLHVGRASHADHRDMGQSPLGKLPGSVWEIPTEPLTVPAELGIDHFAAFPAAWPRRIILGWSPSGICTACGEGRRPVTDVQYLSVGDKFAGGTAVAGRHRSGKRMGDGALASIVGEVCACPEPTAPTRPALILDPFGGTGTVALVARALGRHAISVDRSADYCRLAQWRTTDPGQLAKVLGVPKPPPQVDGQAGLFEIAS